jgi:hypothetical protein
LASRFFFEETSIARDTLTEISDHCWITATGLWNLRWQVQGFKQAIPDANEAHLKARFVLGSSMGRTNLTSTCIGQPWDRQRHWVAASTLVNIFAVYEWWVESILEYAGKNTRKFRDGMQYPAESTHGKGIRRTLNELTSLKSPVTDQCFTYHYKSGRDYRLDILENLLVSYRYYKEMRNVIAHKRGKADQFAISAWQSYKNLIENANFDPQSNLNVKDTPIESAMILGEDVLLDTYTVAGFSGIIYTLLTTLDAELSSADFAERIIIERLMSVPKGKRTIAARGDDKTRSLRKFARYARLPPPRNEAVFEDWLRANGQAV